MTVTITSSLRIGLVSGTGVTFNAPVVPQITTDDIFDADNPSQTLTQLIGGLSSEQLAGTISVDGTQVQNHSIYTVPAVDTFVPTKLIVYVTDITGSGTPPSINVGWTASSYNDLVDDSTLLSTTVGDIQVLADFAATGTSYEVAPGGTVLKVRVSTATSYDTYTFTALLFGFVA